MRNVLLSLAQAFVVGSYRQMNLYKQNYINRPRVACGLYKLYPLFSHPFPFLQIKLFRFSFNFLLHT